MLTRQALPLLLLAAAVAYPATEQDYGQDLKSVVAVDNRFGFRLFTQLVGSESTQNVFISPLSISMSLAMVCNGAAGTTRTQVAEALGIAGLPLEALGRANSALLGELRAISPQTRLEFANSLWAREGIEFLPEFLAAAEQSYTADVAVLDFDSSGALQTINQWVWGRTRGCIPTVIDQIDPLARLIALNAVYFTGNWADPFDPTATRERDFFARHSAVKRHMMHRYGSYDYLSADGFQAVSLPYGSERLSMYLFVPEAKDGLDSFLGQLTQENWDRWLGEFRRSDGDVILPRFRNGYQADLQDALAKLGMAAAFEREEADFSNMSCSTSAAWISEVRHKTLVEVKEEGIEPRVLIGGIEENRWPAPGSTDRFHFVADHPFFCAIVDSRTGTILFMGAITDPKQ